MKNYNKSLSNLRGLKSFLVFIFLLAISVLLPDCSKQNMSSKIKRGPNALENSSVTNEDYFRAVFFLDGPLARKLGDYAELSPDNILTDKGALANFRNGENRIIDYINKNNNSFFSDFKQKITSGDYSIVEAAIKEAGIAFGNAIRNTNDLNKNYTDARVTQKDITNMIASTVGNTSNMPIRDVVSKIRINSQLLFDSINNKIPQKSLTNTNVNVNVNTSVDFYQYTVIFLYAGGFVAYAVAVVLTVGVETPAIKISSDLLKYQNSYLYQDFLSTVTANMVE